MSIYCLAAIYGAWINQTTVDWRRVNENLYEYVADFFYYEFYSPYIKMIKKIILVDYVAEIRAMHFTAVDAYIAWEKFEFIWAFPESFVYEWEGVTYNSLLQYKRLYAYCKGHLKAHYTFGHFFEYKKLFNIVFNRDNAFFNGIMLRTEPYTGPYAFPMTTYELITITWYKTLRTLLIPMFITIILTLILINFFYINLLKQLAIWAIIGLLFFWLISGFNFFLKRYRFGKFTSAILRFWKRTNAIFWIIEGFLFSLFFYYYLNSSQEPLYFYDTSSLNQDYLPALTLVYVNYLLLLGLIWYAYYILLNLSHTTFKQNLIHLTLITILFIYIYLLESYQVYYVLTIFYESVWVFDTDTNVWVLDVESPRLRNKTQYLLLALIAKYWHFLFIFLSWLFFIFKSYEQRRVHYTQFSWNIQNLLILFILNILFIAQWAKYLIRRFYDCIYYWFFTDSNMITLKLYIQELSNLINSCCSYNFYTSSIYYYCYDIGAFTLTILL